MRRIGTVVVVVLTVLAGVALPAVGMGGSAVIGSVDGSGAVAQTATENTSAAPGTRLAGSVGVQGAELGGELESRSLDHQLNRSTSNDSKAAVIARQANQSQARSAALSAQLEALEAARANGSISDQEYRVRAAQLSARVSALERVTTQTSARADRLPAETLRRNGVNASALERLRTNASELAGTEVAAIARSLAGPAAGRGFGPNAVNETRAGSAGEPRNEPGNSQRAEADRAGGASRPGSSAPRNGTTTTTSDEQPGGERGQNTARGNGTGSDGESRAGSRNGG